MKNNKIGRTLLRTIGAIMLIVVSASIGMQAYNWQTWCPNNDLGAAMVVTMYVMSAMCGCIGLYGLSPIYWKAILALVCAKISGNNAHIEDARIEILRLRKIWAW